MTLDVVSIGKEATLAEIARTLESHAIKRVAVVAGGRLAGIVSRSDVLRGLASLGTAGNQQGASSDLVTRQEILDLIRTNTLVSLQAVSIIVVGGVVYLWGITETQREREAVRVAAETVVGPSNVRDHMNTLPQVLHGV